MKRILILAIVLLAAQFTKAQSDSIVIKNATSCTVNITVISNSSGTGCDQALVSSTYTIAAGGTQSFGRISSPPNPYAGGVASFAGLTVYPSTPGSCGSRVTVGDPNCTSYPLSAHIVLFTPGTNCMTVCSSATVDWDNSNAPTFVSVKIF